MGMNASPHVNQFTQVDHTEDPDFFVRFMDEAQKPPGIQASNLFGDAEAIPFPDDTFDACRAARLLEHLPDGSGALGEMVRVTRPGGRIVVFDIDWDTLIIDHPDKQTTRTFVVSHSDSIRNGWIGRQLPRLFKEQHLEVGSVDPVQVSIHYALAALAFGGHLVLLQTNGTLPAARAQQWREYLQLANEEQTLLMSFTGFIVAGTRSRS